MGIKHDPHDDNETVDGQHHQDPSSCVITFFHTLHPTTAQEFTSSLQNSVQNAHTNPAAWGEPQRFEEGDVSLFVPQFKDFPPNVYLMDFYDIEKKGICSRMHVHTGLRFVFIFTGPDSVVNVSSFSPLVLQNTSIGQSKDKMPGLERDRYTYIVPPNSLVSVQIPTMQSHQFNAVGPYAAILSVHIEEALELNREGIPESHMMRQTLFAQKDKPSLAECGLTETAIHAMHSVVSAPLEPKQQNILDFSSRVTRKTAAIAAGVALYGAGLVGLYRVGMADHNSFLRHNPVVLNIDYDPGDMGAAYGDPSDDPIYSTKIYLPKEIYDLYLKNRGLIKDPELTRFASSRDSSSEGIAFRYGTDTHIKEVRLGPNYANDINELAKALERATSAKISKPFLRG